MTAQFVSNLTGSSFSRLSNVSHVYKYILPNIINNKLLDTAVHIFIVLFLKTPNNHQHRTLITPNHTRLFNTHTLTQTCYLLFKLCVDTIRNFTTQSAKCFSQTNTNTLTKASQATHKTRYQSHWFII